MRANGVRSLDVTCWQCHHRAIMSADRWPDHMAVPTFGPRMVCTRCGIVGADARPHWQEQPPRESLTGFTAELLVDLLRDGLATAAPGIMYAGRRPITVTLLYAPPLPFWAVRRRASALWKRTRIGPRW
jgi:hypothetical protein